MKKIIATTLAFLSFSLHAAVTVPFAPTPDPLHEINAIEKESPKNDLQGVVLTAFAQLAHCFANIVQAPKDPHIVGANIAHMVSSVAGVVAHAIQRIPATMSEEERLEYIEEIEKALKTALRRIAIVKKSLTQ